ncbi:MAG: NAD-dependent epimerase/dehydratase family protein [Anaerolineales bacterium]|nr:NAD-dependent epimerase/dehydratase family protein [Anaerolineales bacterium]
MELATVFSNQQVMITGGLGFIGSNLARKLVELNADVTLVDSLDPQTGANVFNIHDIQDRVTVVEADIRSDEKIRAILPQAKFLFNLAGQTSHLSSMQDPLSDLEVNAVSQLKLIEACRLLNPGVRIVFAGTRQIYGRPKRLPVDEKHIPAPVDYNGVSKRAGEMYHIVGAQIYGMWTSVLRMTNVYGPRMRVKDDRQNFIGWWFRQLLEGEEISVYGDGKQFRDLNYVDDVVDALLLCTLLPAAKGNIYNLGAQPIRLIDLARMMIEINGGGNVRQLSFPKERKRIDIGDYFGDFNKIMTDLGWRPKISLRDGIERTLSFYRDNKEQYW